MRKNSRKELRVSIEIRNFYTRKSENKKKINNNTVTQQTKENKNNTRGKVEINEKTKPAYQQP